jgi:hypothetical protein
MLAVSSRSDTHLKRIERIRLMDWHLYSLHERIPTTMRVWTGMTQKEYDFTVSHWSHLVVVYRHRLQHLRRSGRWMQFKPGEYAVQLRKAQNNLNAVQNDLIAIQAAWNGGTR